MWCGNSLGKGEYHSFIIQFKNVYINMNFKLLKNIEEFIERKHRAENQNPSSMYSATLKNKRLEMNMTLGDLTEGICSKSYVSKIENNLLVPDEYVMRLLFEKVDINYTDLVKSDCKNVLPDCVLYFLYHKYEAIDQVYQQLDDTYFIARNAIVKLFYYLSHQMHEQFITVVKQINEVKNTLEDDEFLTWMFCIVEYYIQTNQFRLAKKYLKILQDIKMHPSPLKSLFIQQRFIVACHLRDYVYAQKFYQKLRDLYIINYPYKRQFYEKLMFLETFYQEYNTLEELNHMAMDIIPEEYEQDFWYIKTIVLVKSNNYIAAIETMMDNELHDARYLALFGYCLKMLLAMPRRIPELKKYHDHFKMLHEKASLQEIETIHMHFIQLMVLEINKAERHEIFDYLKNFILIHMANYQHRFYTKYYKDKYIELLGENSRYKEAYLFALSHPELSKKHLKK